MHPAQQVASRGRLAGRVYDGLPRALQTAAVSLKGWAIRRERYGGSFAALLADYASRTLASDDEVLAARRAKLRCILVHARAHIPYWSQRLRTFDIDPERVQGPEDLRSLPILTKDEVLRLGAGLHWPEAPRGATRLAHTSGTTGAGLIFPVTLEAERDQWAVWWRFRQRQGLSLETWHGMLTGSTIVPGNRSDPRPWRVNYPGRQVFFSQHHLGPGTAAEIALEIGRRSLSWLHGYPSAVSALATMAMEAGARLPRPRVISLGAESVQPAQIRAIRDGFGVDPVSHYGLAEMVANASGCPAGRFHIDEDFAAVELLPEGDGAVRLVGTSLSNLAMPLIRYDTGDLARLYPARCGCGLPGRALESIDGRREDLIELSDGSRVGRADHLFKDAVRVAEAQIRQSEAGRCTIAVVPREGFGAADEAEILGECRRRFGDRLSVRIERVASIPRTASGKLRLVVRTEDAPADPAATSVTA